MVSLVSRGRRDGRRHANVGRNDGQEGLDWRAVAVARIFMLFLARATVLKPDLRDSLTQSGHVGDSFEILSIGIAIYGEVCLQHLQLLLRECRSDALRFVFIEAVAVVAV